MAPASSLAWRDRVVTSPGCPSQTPDVAGKRIELLRDVVPGLRRFAILANPDNSYVALELREVQAAARMLDLEVALFEIRRAEDIALAFEGLKGRADALYIMPDAIGANRRDRCGPSVWTYSR